ncbi:MAG: GNAT family N-acetyltransferase [Chloroflexota bacterium]
MFFGPVELLVRTFVDGDYERVAEIGAAIDPLYSSTPETLRRANALVEPRVRRFQLVAEVDGAGVVGWGCVSHIWWVYHPRRYFLCLDVDPDWQRRGIGSTLFDALLHELRSWGPELIRSATLASRAESVGFLEQRGFREWRRRWESVLDVATADLTALLVAEERAATQGLRFTNYGVERAQRGDRLARDVYDLEMAIFRTEFAAHGDVKPMSFDRFLAISLDTPDVLHEAHFLALDDERVVGLSRLTRDLNHAHVIRQAFTGTHPEYRGRGIAQALKLRTVEFARKNGYREIHTTNDSTNAPMLHINELIGFRKETPEIIFERRLDGERLAASPLCAAPRGETISHAPAVARGPTTMARSQIPVGRPEQTEFFRPPRG